MATATSNKKTTTPQKGASKTTVPKKTASPNGTAKKAASPKGPASEPVATDTANPVTSIKVRMYRGGTGDFFLLQFKSNEKVVFNMMIDCGCIKGGAKTFEPLIADLKEQIKKGNDYVIDLLVVTHEHADHINGFKHSANLFDTIQFKKVWFAWTEDDTDKTANEYRKKYTKTKMALAEATKQLTGLVQNKYYEEVYKNQFERTNLLGAQKLFISSIAELTALNSEPQTAGGKIKTMADLLEDYKVIKAQTVVEFLSPGDIRTNLSQIPGIRFFVLGPPRDLDSLSTEEKAGEGYAKREHASSVDFALVNVLTSGDNVSTAIAFDTEYEETKTKNTPGEYKVSEAYTSQPWRQIDYDWLYSSGSLALRFQRSINNTSLALAIQFEQSEKVLLFPGDAEYGNWMSWHKELAWTIRQGGKMKKVDATYLLNNTVFYKVGHHLSQNGTAKAKGLELMEHEDLAAMVTLDFKKINSGWLNTMPSDTVGAELIRKTNGQLLFAGDYKKILKNIKTNRVTVKQANETNLLQLNQPFEGKPFIDWEVKA